jgi:hypothetical protein
MRGFQRLWEGNMNKGSYVLVDEVGVVMPVSWNVL